MARYRASDGGLDPGVSLRMRIAFVIPYFVEAWEYGGPPRSAYEIARGMANRGHAMKVLTTDTGGRARLSSRQQSDISSRCHENLKIRHYRNISNRLAFRHRFFLAPTLSSRIRNELDGYDLIHIHELRSMTSVSAYRAALDLGIPYVVSPHGGLLRLGKSSRKVLYDALWGRSILKSASALLAVSELEAEQASSLGISVEKVRILPNPVRTEDYRDLPAEGTFREKWKIRTPKLVLFLGRLNHIKGVDLLVSACTGLGADVHLAIAGPDDGEETALRRQVAAEMNGRVTFVGFLGHTEKLAALVDSDVCVVPSRNEIFGMVALESLMCEKPIVMSSACGLASQLAGQPGVFVFEAGDVRDLARKMKSVLEKSGDSFGDTARMVESEFSLETTLDKAESVYQEFVVESATP